MLSPYRDRIAAKHFLQLTLWRVGQLRPRVINVDGHPAYPFVISELKQTGELSKVCRCRPSPYLNNIIEQDHRFIKKRIVVLAELYKHERISLRSTVRPSEGNPLTGVPIWSLIVLADIPVSLVKQFLVRVKFVFEQRTAEFLLN